MTLEVLSETYDVTHESDGLAGRDRALRGGFDVILLDRRLPHRDGAEIVRDLRAAHITTPVLMLNALGGERRGERRRAGRRGRVLRSCAQRARAPPRRRQESGRRGQRIGNA